MSAVQSVNRNGKNILVMDLSNVSDISEISKRVAEIMVAVKNSGKPKSVYALLDLTNLKINKNTLPFLKMLSQNNGPFIKYVAFVGLNAIYSFMFRTLFKMTKRVNHTVVQTREEAMNWLVNH